MHTRAHDERTVRTVHAHRRRRRPIRVRPVSASLVPCGAGSAYGAADAPAEGAVSDSRAVVYVLRSSCEYHFRRAVVNFYRHAYTSHTHFQTYILYSISFNFPRVYYSFIVRSLFIYDSQDRENPRCPCPR